MDQGRFQELADAYGADIGRWPGHVRTAAHDVARDGPAWAKAMLAEADALDGLLDATPVLRGSAGLAERIVAAAPVRRERSRTAWLFPAGLGAGLAAACAAGLLAGAQLAHSLSAESDSTIAALAGDDVSGYGEGV